MSGTARSQQRMKKPAARKLIGEPVSAAATGRAAPVRPARLPAATASAWSKLKLEHDITGLKAHDLVTKGVPVAAAKRVMGAFNTISEAEIYSVLGISAKTLQRRGARAEKTLDPNASDRALRLIAVTNQAVEVLGSQEAAERWLTQPAMGLDRRRPIELLQSSEGTDMVKTLLGRMEYGVYS